MEQQTSKAGGQTLLSWHGPQHVHVHPNPRVVLIALLLLVVIVGYAVISNNPMMAITFILIGFVGYLFLTRDPRSLDYVITTKGLIVGREMFSYDSIESFWIFDGPPLENVLSLKSDGILAPYIHIPLLEESVGEIHQIMLTYLPEEKQEPRAVDILEKIIHS
ncbi:MAG: hypothetical protein ABI747_00760 [Candidatus Moraniibacteriota bacterium]